MTRYQLTPLPEVRAYGVDRVSPTGRLKRIKTFDEKDRDAALKLVYTLNKR